jgi:hypothetical protein
MNAYVPGNLMRDASARLVHSALPDAPVRLRVAPPPIAAACRRALAAALFSLAAVVRPLDGDPQPSRLSPIRSQSDGHEDKGPDEAWRDAAALCADAFTAWRTAEPTRRSEAHVVYCAALDREEAAARELARARTSSRICSAIRPSSTRR